MRWKCWPAFFKPYAILWNLTRHSVVVIAALWVGQAPTRIIIIFVNFVFLCGFFFVEHFSPKKNWIGEWWVRWGLGNPSFSRIFGFFLT